jgi:hypothetical protein
MSVPNAAAERKSKRRFHFGNHVCRLTARIGVANYGAMTIRRQMRRKKFRHKNILIALLSEGTRTPVE